ncbi:protein of unknown function [Ruminococcaceae bacterium BL-6]|nr:protein of unknown function [Ruminococcaceae bacterium BL-6]
MRKEFAVKYSLDENQQNKLVNLFNRWNTLYPNDEDTPEKLFEFIMTLGSSYVIDDCFDRRTLFILRRVRQ